jgi:hypothetical protein
MYVISPSSVTEPCSSDPWWIYTTCNLFWVIKSQYDFGITELVRVSPRFGIMLLSMCLSIVFIIVDILSVLHVFGNALPTGINPFWKVRRKPLNHDKAMSDTDIRYSCHLFSNVSVIP